MKKTLSVFMLVEDLDKYKYRKRVIYCDSCAAVIGVVYGDNKYISDVLSGSRVANLCDVNICDACKRGKERFSVNKTLKKFQ